MRFFIALFFSATIPAVAQRPEVPHKMQFAGMTLTIRDDARREIQKDVDAMTASPRHFNIKVERARTYFPIIEKIFAEEGVPDDFKYLSLQESALIADAVSVSNAVGFWQFKEFTAVEMGLRVDKEVDERLNIASASRGAARYIKRNNMMFNNWIFALQAYQMGAGGVMQSVKETHSGATHMEITSKTYWYVKKYLAHKVAYENSVGGKGQISLLTLENKTRRSLSDLSKEMSVDEAELASYNKWAKRGVIPDDRTYLVVIPVTSETPVNPNLIASAPLSTHSAAKSPVAVPAMSATGAIRVNGIATIIATQGDTPTKLATRAGVDLSAFLKWNDLSISDAVQPGQRLLLGKKRARSTEAYHKVRTGETLWSVSQLYGVQMKKLRKYNRMSSSDGALTPGTTLWLSSMRPRESNRAVNNAAVVQIDQQETFAWETAPVPVAVVTPPPPVQNIPVVPQNTAQDTVKNIPVTPAPTPVAVVEDTTTNVKTADVAASIPDSVQTLQVPPPTVPDVKDSVATISVTPPPLKKNTHVVQAKETLYGIARQYNLAVMDLVRWNNLDLQQGIRPGQVIKLTDPQPVTEQPVAAAQPTHIIHEVKPSDTLYSVARKYGVTIKELMDWNGKKDFSLSTGEKLKVLQK